jgi:Holliday junction resolvase RusA-like endonuclease
MKLDPKQMTPLALARLGLALAKEDHARSNRTPYSAANVITTAAQERGPGTPIVVRLIPIGKPRMTQRDKWAKRPAVIRYREFADSLRLQIGHLVPPDVLRLSWIAYFPMPESWSKKKKEEMRGKPHRQKPDRDNVDKAILDSLFDDDSGIASGTLDKRWDDDGGARIELTFN